MYILGILAGLTAGKPAATAAPQLWLTLLNSLPNQVTQLIGGILAGLAGVLIQKYSHGKQVERDNLAFARATAERKRTLLYPAYQDMRRLVRAYEGLSLAIEQDRDKEAVEVASASLVQALKEAEEAQSAYMLVNKEDEVHTTIQSLHNAFTGWASLRENFCSLKDANAIVASLPTMSYETVQKAREQFEAKRDELLTLAKAWEKELP